MKSESLSLADNELKTTAMVSRLTWRTSTRLAYLRETIKANHTEFIFYCHLAQGDVNITEMAERKTVFLRRHFSTCKTKRIV
jgi:hypothetical protein